MITVAFGMDALPPQWSGCRCELMIQLILSGSTPMLRSRAAKSALSSLEAGRLWWRAKGAIAHEAAPQSGVEKREPLGMIDQVCRYRRAQYVLLAAIEKKADRRLNPAACESK